MRKKVGIFIRSLNKGGAENQSVILAKALSSDYDVKLILLFNEGELINNARDVLKPKNIIFIKGQNYLSKTYHFFKYLKNERIDHLFCYLPSNNIIGLVIGKLAGIKYIFGGIRGSKIKNSRAKMFFQKILLNNFSTAIISNSYKAKDTYSLFGIKKDKIHVIHNGIEINRERSKRRHKDKVNILSVGRFVPEKDYKTALLAIKEIKDLMGNAIDFNYTIVGYGEQENLIKNLVSNFGLENYVELIIDPKSVDPYYKEADIFLLTSKNEGMPNVIMEAMSFSLPVVTTDVGDASYLVKDGSSGFISPVGNHKHLAENLIKLISSHDLRIDFGEMGFELLSKNFSIGKLKEEYVSIIEAYN